jgi:hypothetical protein
MQPSQHGLQPEPGWPGRGSSFGSPSQKIPLPLGCFRSFGVRVLPHQAGIPPLRLSTCPCKSGPTPIDRIAAIAVHPTVETQKLPYHPGGFTPCCRGVLSFDAIKKAVVEPSEPAQNKNADNREHRSDQSFHGNWLLLTKTPYSRLNRMAFRAPKRPSEFSRLKRPSYTQIHTNLP